jgi:hypothetical protein
MLTVGNHTLGRLSHFNLSEVVPYPGHELWAKGLKDNQ